MTAWTNPIRHEPGWPWQLSERTKTRPTPSLPAQSSGRKRRQYGPGKKSRRPSLEGTPADGGGNSQMTGQVTGDFIMERIRALWLAPRQVRAGSSTLKTP